MRKRAGDAAMLLILAVAVIALAWLCSRAEVTTSPNESDCIEELRSATRKTTNYTEEELIRYGRCFVERSK